MKFSIVALLAGTAAAQVSVATDALAAISSATSALASAINAYVPGSGADSPVVGAVNDLQNAITTGNTNVAAIDQLSLIDSTALIDPVTALAATADTTITALIGLQDQLQTDCVATLASQLLSETYDNVKTFEATLRGKVFPGAQMIADGLIAQINASFDRGVAAYASATSCDGTTSTTTGGSESTTTTTTSGTATTGPTTGTSTTTSGTATTSTTSTTTGTSTRPTGPIYTGAAATNYMNFGAAVMAAAAVAVL